MNKDEILIRLKQDLQISVDAYDDDLEMVLELALGDLERQGINIDFTEDADCALLKTYTAWLVRHRKDSEKPMLLTRLIHNRILSEKLGD